MLPSDWPIYIVATIYALVSVIVGIFWLCVFWIVFKLPGYLRRQELRTQQLADAVSRLESAIASLQQQGLQADDHSAQQRTQLYAGMQSVARAMVKRFSASDSK